MLCCFWPKALEVWLPPQPTLSISAQWLTICTWCIHYSMLIDVKKMDERSVSDSALPIIPAPGDDYRETVAQLPVITMPITQILRLKNHSQLESWTEFCWKAKPFWNVIIFQCQILISLRSIICSLHCKQVRITVNFNRYVKFILKEPNMEDHGWSGYSWDWVRVRTLGSGRSGH